MADEQVQVRISGDASGGVAAMQAAAQAVRSGVDQMKSSLESVKSAFEMVETAMLGLAAIAAGGALFKEMISGTNNTAVSVERLSRVMGMSAEDASVLNVALKLIGSSSEQYTQIAMVMTRQLEAHKDRFAELGLSMNDANGQTKSANQLMQDGYQWVMQYKEGTDRNAAAQALWGRQAKDNIVMMERLNDVTDRARQLAQQYGLVLSQDDIDATREFQTQQAAMSLMFESIEEKISRAVMPALEQFAGWLSEVGPGVVNGFVVAIKVLVTALEGIIYVARSVWDALQQFGEKVAVWSKTLAQVFLDFENFKWGDIAKTWDRGMTELDQVTALHFAAQTKMAADLSEHMQKLWSGGEEGAGGGAAKKKKSGGGGDKQFEGIQKPTKSRTADWEADLTAEKAAFAVMHDGRQMDIEDEINYWSKLLAIKDLSAEEARTINNKINELTIQDERKAAEERQKIALDRIETEKKVADGALAQRAQEIATEKELGKISATQELAQLVEVEDAKYAVAMQALKKKQELYEQDKAAQAKVNDEIIQLQIQHSAALQKINDKAALDQQKAMQQMLAPIQSAIDKSVVGMINGTMTAQKALYSIQQSILSDFVNTIGQRVAQWLFGESTITAITEGYNAVRAALGFGAAATAKASKSAEAVSMVSANAAEAGTGAAASVAAIPYVGWAMAPGVMASTIAEVLGAGMPLAVAAGGWDLPAGINPLAQLHSREMVLPAEHADVIRGLAGGSGGGQSFHYHDHSGRLSPQAIRENAGLFAQAMREQHRKGSRFTRP